MFPDGPFAKRQVEGKKGLPKPERGVRPQASAPCSRRWPHPKKGAGSSGGPSSSSSSSLFSVHFPLFSKSPQVACPRLQACLPLPRANMHARVATAARPCMIASPGCGAPVLAVLPQAQKTWAPGRLACLSAGDPLGFPGPPLATASATTSHGAECCCCHYCHHPHHRSSSARL